MLFKPELKDTLSNPNNSWSPKLSGYVCEFCALKLGYGLTADMHESVYCKSNPNSEASKNPEDYK